MKVLALVAALMTASGFAHAGDRYKVEDEGAFGPTGRHVEFSDRYGWRSYKIAMDFSLDESGRKLEPKSTLTLTITKKDGGKWSYKCRADKAGQMWANVNLLWGKGTNVLTECRIDPEAFAEAVGLEADMVGEPTLVFAARIKEGKASAGLQKGLYFLAGGQIAASQMNQYATQNDDPSDLAVLFASDEGVAQLPARHPHMYYYQPPARFVP